MKTKNKIIVLLEIAIVLCSVFMMALPTTAIAAEEDDFVLGVYGNANEDDTIDMRDLTYVKLIFFGKKPETELADAKYDGKINPLDFIQIKLIIVGKEKELTIVDTKERIVTVKKPVKRIVLCDCGETAKALLSLKAEDKVVGATERVVAKRPIIFRSFSELPSIGVFMSPDCEAILSIGPDIVIASDWTPKPSLLEDKLADITVIRLGFYKPERMTENMRKLGYILNMKDNANEFINFYEGYQNTIKERVGKLSEDNKPRVYLEHHTAAYRTYNKGMGCHQLCTLAGGINIAADLSGYTPTVDREWVLEQNPDMVVKMTYKVGFGYDTDDPSEMKALRNEIMDRTGWEHIKAVKEGNVYAASGDVMYGPSNYIGAIYLAKWFHPELFKDLDPQAIHQEYIDRFCTGLDYDLDEHGVFVYPP